MSCQKVSLPGGSTAILCGRKRGGRPRCSTPNCYGRADYLCDRPVLRDGRKGTCDRRLCSFHASPVGEDQHYCPPHANAARPAAQGSLL